MTAPTTYSDWVAVLTLFGNGDDTLFDEMDSGNFELDSGTAQRFYLRVEEAYKKRKQNWLNKFQHSFHMQNIRNDDDFGITLRNGKQNLLPLSKFVSAKGLPEDLRKTLQKDLDDFVAEIKKSLKDNVSKKSNAKEKMHLMLNTFGLPEIKKEELDFRKTSVKVESSAVPSKGRKIIF